MSLLSADAADFAPRGRPLPNRVYLATVEEVSINELDNGTQLARRYGNLRTEQGAGEFELPDGSTFTIGNRKVFHRSWIDHKVELAAKIGQGEIKREAVAAGLMKKPEKGATTTLDFESWPSYAEALAGKDVKIRTKQVKRLGKDRKTVMKDDDGREIIDVEVAEWLPV